MYRGLTGSPNKSRSNWNFGLGDALFIIGLGSYRKNEALVKGIGWGPPKLFVACTGVGREVGPYLDYFSLVKKPYFSRPKLYFCKNIFGRENWGFWQKRKIFGENEIFWKINIFCEKFKHRSCLKVLMLLPKIDW